MAESELRRDRLYELLPAIHRQRDAQQGYPLKALLAVIGEQVELVDDDIAQLYENWFIETAQDWAVPYIGALLGHVPLAEAGLPPDISTCATPRRLVPRREIAGLIHARRRKGSLALLEELARDIGGWPARAVEAYRRLAWTQNLNHPHLQRHRLADLRAMDALDRLGTPFERAARTVDLRRGGVNIATVDVYAWRLQRYSVTATAACCVEESGPQCFSFSVLGQDAPLWRKPLPENDPAHIASEENIPAPIRRRAFKQNIAEFYGPERSLLLWADGWAGFRSDQPVPAEKLIAADLSDWRYAVPNGHVAVDPVLGRFAFPAGQLPKKGVRVSYHYGFSADLGGGEYARPLLQPPARPGRVQRLYRVGRGQDYSRIADALLRWEKDAADDAVIELCDSGVYVEPINIQIENDKTLQLRAAQHTRPVLRLIDWQTDLPDAFAVSLGSRSRFSLDGLLVTGRPLRVSGRPLAAGECPGELVIRHCTLVPGWGLDCRCEPRRPAEPSLELAQLRGRVRISHSILGAILVQQDEVLADPLRLDIADSIVDATSDRREAITGGAPGRVAHVLATIRRSTIFGIVELHALELGENCIFSACVHVARRQIGCLRYSYVPAGCRTPRRHRCQPDGVAEAVRAASGDGMEQRIALEHARVRPRFTARRDGQPGYAQLAADCANEIVRGADDESEMGAFHHLYQPQRSANLRARLAEYTPAGMQVELVFVN